MTVALSFAFHKFIALPSKVYCDAFLILSRLNDARAGRISSYDRKEGFPLSEERKCVRALIWGALGAVALNSALRDFQSAATTLARGLELFEPLFVGFAIAFVLNPVVRFFEERAFFRCNKKHTRRGILLCRGLSVGATCVTVACAVGIFFLVVAPEFATAAGVLRENLADYLSGFATWAEGAEKTVEHYVNIPDFVDWQEIAVAVARAVGIGQESGMIDGAVNLTASLLGETVDVLLGAILAVYILVQKERIARFFRNSIRAFSPKKTAERIFHVFRIINSTFRGFVGGQIAEALIFGGLIFLGMKLLRLPYAAAVAAVMSITALVPIVGAWVGTLLCMLILLSTSPANSLLFLAFELVAQMIDNNLIYPRVMGRSIGMPGLLILVAVLLGGAFGGIVGALLGAPVLAVLYALLRETVAERLARKGLRRE